MPCAQQLVAQPVRRRPVAGRPGRRPARRAAPAARARGPRRRPAARRGPGRGRAGPRAPAPRRRSTSTARRSAGSASRTRSNSAASASEMFRSSSSAASKAVARRRRARRAASGRPAGPRGTPSSAATSGVEPVERGGGRGQRLVGVVEARAVVDGDQGVPQGARRDPGLEQVADAGDVPGRLGHLRAARLEVRAVQPGLRRTARPVAASLWAISSSWCGKIRSTPPVWMSNDGPRWAMLIAEHSMCQPGRPVADRRLPRRLAGLRALPQREVADVVLGVLVGLDPLAHPELRRDRAGRAARTPATTRSGRRSSRRRSGRRGRARAASR